MGPAIPVERYRKKENRCGGEDIKTKQEFLYSQ